MDDDLRLRIGRCIPAICLTTGGLLLAIALIWVANAWLSAPAWATVDGQIVQAGVTSDMRTTSRISGNHRGGGNTHEVMFYSPDVVYNYRVGGRDYTGIGIGDGGDYSYDSPGEADAAVAPYRQRLNVTVYYDPADPERSCLDTSFMLGFVPWVIGGIGLLLLVLGLGLRRARRVEEEE
jgi:hypothetical protein